MMSPNAYQKLFDNGMWQTWQAVHVNMTTKVCTRLYLIRIRKL